MRNKNGSNNKNEINNTKMKIKKLSKNKTSNYSIGEVMILNNNKNKTKIK